MISGKDFSNWGGCMKGRIHYKPFGHIFLYITDNCNLRCKYCYIGNRLNRPRKEMSLKDVYKILNYFCRFDSKFVTILGGEPTLHKNIYSIISLANDLGYHVYLDTNGTFHSQFLEKVKCDSLYYFSFSLDGSNEKLNSILRGPGVFEICVKNIKRAVELGFDVRITPTLTKINADDASNIISLAENLGCKLVNFHNFIPRAYGNRHLDWILHKDDWINTFNKIKKSSEKSHITIWCPPEYATHEEFKRYLKEGYKGCIARYLDRCSIFPDGRVYLCSLLFDFPSYNFFVFENSKLKFNKGFNEMDVFFGIENCCKDCENLRNCGGVCPARNFQYRKLKLHEVRCDKKYIPLCPLWKTTLNKKSD